MLGSETRHSPSAILSLSLSLASIADSLSLSVSLHPSIPSYPYLAIHPIPSIPYCTPPYRLKPYGVSPPYLAPSNSHTAQHVCTDGRRTRHGRTRPQPGVLNVRRRWVLAAAATLAFMLGLCFQTRSRLDSCPVFTARMVRRELRASRFV